MPNPFNLSKSRLTVDYQVGVYLANRQTTRYFHHAGKLPVPLARRAGTGPTAHRAADGGETLRVVRTSAPYGGKVVLFEVARLGLEPRYPSPDVSDTNLEFLGGEVFAEAPAIDPDGSTYTYHVWGWYAYAFRRPLWVKDRLPIGALVIDSTPPGQNVLSPEKFITRS